MSREKQIEIKVVTYKEERLNYFTALYEKAKNKFDRLFKKHKDAPYLSDEFQKMSDAGHEAEFLGDVVKMLKRREGELRVEIVTDDFVNMEFAKERGWYRKRFYCPNCDLLIKTETWDRNRMFGCGTVLKSDDMANFCPNCGAEMKCDEQAT